MRHNRLVTLNAVKVIPSFRRPARIVGSALNLFIRMPVCSSSLNAEFRIAGVLEWGWYEAPQTRTGGWSGNEPLKAGPDLSAMPATTRSAVGQKKAATMSGSGGTTLFRYCPVSGSPALRRAATRFYLRARLSFPADNRGTRHESPYGRFRNNGDAFGNTVM